MHSTLKGVTIAAALLLLAAGLEAPPSFACGFDGLLGDGFSAEHPKSIAVAFAISDAVSAGIIDKTAIAPIDAGSRGYWQAVGHISSFQQLLSSASSVGAQSPGISLLFIDSKLWSRFSPGPKGYQLQMHTAGASPDDVVIVTSEAILAAVLVGAMQAENALDLGLIAIDGNQNQVEAMRETILATTDRIRTGVAAGSLARPVRLFGPAR